ncbi:MAG: hypothetical protein AAFU78_23440 [Cyanobacteria bacterium J06633_2]
MGLFVPIAALSICTWLMYRPIVLSAQLLDEDSDVGWVALLDERMDPLCWLNSGVQARAYN